MNVDVLVAFNLLVNAIGSFLVAWALVALGAPFFRRAPGKAAILLAASPFLKIVWDVCRGIPDGSFLWLRVAGATQDRGSFMAGVGVERVFLALRLSLAAELDGARYGLSGADLVAGGIVKHVGTWAPAAIVVGIATVAVLLLVRRARGALALVRHRRTLRSTGKTLTVDRRRIPFLRDDIATTPYTGGVFSPFVAVPRRFLDLPEAERDAALAHELGHVAERHVAISIASGILCDVFWFVPGIRRARRAVLASLEASADAWAVRRGVAPAVLASALVRCAELGGTTPRSPAAALAAVEPTLVGRVRRLLGDDPPGRFTLTRPLGRALAVAWLVTSILIATGFGNR